ncbi:MULTISPECIES: exodeoxyribonuclease VII small subunit [unclassified Rothia (in: high G+C Gram-positive bacteria)]|uniref:exodeoxyribonuclease VII small subunit n=1 Tax=unclassified Rothia (in: high G+C Gram-positive bacteria) TaxID=2689056 RepID=UPI00195EC440|nr:MULTISPECIES: exodeoxyribonuclease VII small subunit [unclassified Rothia (in: high G+C Gram-positive bacteria)]MBM7051151.1 exodeoxyribonuclease VII small subunit [Rothia sp. ZJ1223]QRZ62151.1 exodeoxyribonuclease VII small subunit [Rothia sp. ZJ932]
MSENITFNDSTGGAPVEQLSYEQARAELMQVVQRMESGASSLEDSIALWERGEALAARCEAWLDGAQARLQAAQNNQQEHNNS